MTSCNTRCNVISTPVKTFRTDTATEEALAYLIAETGNASVSDLVRTCILEMADTHRRAALRAEAQALRDDPDDVAEMRAVMADMEALSAW